MSNPAATTSRWRDKRQLSLLDLGLESHWPANPGMDEFRPAARGRFLNLPALSISIFLAHDHGAAARRLEMNVDTHARMHVRPPLRARTHPHAPAPTRVLLGPSEELVKSRRAPVAGAGRPEWDAGGHLEAQDERSRGGGGREGGGQNLGGDGAPARPASSL